MTSPAPIHVTFGGRTDAIPTPWLCARTRAWERNGLTPRAAWQQAVVDWFEQAEVAAQAAKEDRS